MDRVSEAEFEEFMHASYPRLLRTAFLLTGDLGHAEDSVQIALAKAAVVWPRLTREGNIEGYVRKILTNTISSRFRRRWWRETPTSAMEAVDAVDPFLQSEQRDVLRRVLEALPQRQRTAIVLRYFEDLTEHQTAHVMNCSVGTVKSLASRGLQQLRASLDGTIEIREGRVH